MTISGYVTVPGLPGTKWWTDGPTPVLVSYPSGFSGARAARFRAAAVDASTHWDVGWKPSWTRIMEGFVRRPPSLPRWSWSVEWPSQNLPSVLELPIVLDTRVVSYKSERSNTCHVVTFAALSRGSTGDDLAALARVRSVMVS
jgi:hypothetical protein